MTVGIVGLGLIGGSFARAITALTKHKVLGYDIKESAFCVFSKKINQFIKENKIIWKL